MDNLDEIRARIKDLREFSDYTITQFADKLGLAHELYQDYEEGRKNLPIGIIYAIAGALMIEPGVLLTGDEPNDDECTVVYKGKGREITRYDGYSFSSLNGNFINPALEPMLVTIKEGVLPELVSHEGEEFNYVIEGMLRVNVNSKDYYLKEGDSLYFNAKLPHAQIAMSSIARFITVLQKY
ncbi:MAG: XRE family transcriptional regulator [Christensenellaceae bacterium]|jgi:transcriptional regulator with XRE-family HTH domain|nr:XRE family transcriptional regulator [Christensenellaceae bacterium]